MDVYFEVSFHMSAMSGLINRIINFCYMLISMQHNTQMYMMTIIL